MSRRDAWVIEIAGERIEGILRTYGDRPTGTLIALVGSSGWVEVAVVNGDAARQLTAGAGTTVWFRRRPEPSSRRSTAAYISDRGQRD